MKLLIDLNILNILFQISLIFIYIYFLNEYSDVSI